jgi:hypothetical protein
MKAVFLFSGAGGTHRVACLLRQLVRDAAVSNQAAHQQPENQEATLGPIQCLNYMLIKLGQLHDIGHNLTYFTSREWTAVQPPQWP